MDKLIDYEGLGTFQTNLLNDNKVSPIATWSSEKISDELNDKANTSDLSAYATTSDLSAYATTSAMTTALAGKQDKLTASFGIKFYQLGDILYIDTNGSSYNPTKHSFAINGCNAKGNYSFAEGSNTDAIGSISHAEGNGTDAIGYSSHAEGNSTSAQGDNSHAEGYNTISNNSYEHAEGSCNVSHTGNVDSNKTMHSIGIGYAAGAAYAAHRQNAEEIMKNGDIYVYGVGNYDGIHIKNEQGAPANLQTLQEVISSLTSTIASLEARIVALENPTTVE